jgi:hypothetical protein
MEIEEVMDRFQRIVRGRGLTGEAILEILNQNYLTHDPVCLATVFKWLHGTRPSGARLLGVMDFIHAHRSFLHQKKSVSVPSNKRKSKTRKRKP